MKIMGMDHIALWITDFDRSVKFYEGVLGLKRSLTMSRYPEPSDAIRDLRFVVGDKDSTAGIHIFQSPFAAFRVSKTPAYLPTPEKSAICMDHFAMRVDVEFFQSIQARLENAGVKIDYHIFTSEKNPLYIPSRSIQFSDPDGYVLEFQCYELGV